MGPLPYGSAYKNEMPTAVAANTLHSILGICCEIDSVTDYF